MPAIALADGYALYADKIFQMEEQGHIEAADAQAEVYKLKLREENHSNTLAEQARGVASALSAKKTIKITNKPIEVSLSKN